MDRHETGCECRDEVVRNGAFIIVALTGFALVTTTNFTELVKDIPDHVMKDGLAETWEWLTGAVCEHGGGLWYRCPKEGEESILTKMLTDGFSLFLFVWLATLQPIRRMKRIIAGVRTLADTLKRKLHPKAGIKMKPLCTGFYGAVGVVLERPPFCLSPAGKAPLETERF